MSTVNGFSSSFFPNSKISSTGGLSTSNSQTNAGTPGSPRPDNNEILASSLHFNVQKIPPIEVTSSVGALRVLDAMSYLSSLSFPTQTTVTQNLDKKSLSAGMQTDALINIRDSLTTLSATVTSLGDSLSTKTAKSSDSNLVEAVAGSRSPVSSVTVVSKQAFAGNVLASDEQPSAHPALGLTGSFIVNGHSVSVVSSDTIDTIKDKINHGEDTNHDGKLDGAEDVNGTGQPGVIFVHAREYTPAVYIVKDRNGDGTLNPAEDTNGNDRLDGGTKDNKVVATIEGNRLELTGLGANTINLEDPDNILLSLGFFVRNAKGIPVQKEKQFSTSNSVFQPLPNLMAAPQKAVITVDGKTFTSDTNVFTGVVDDATLAVNKTSGSSVKISISQDPTHAFDKIKALFLDFNNVIRTINDSLITTKTFETDTDIQLLRNKITQTQTGISSATSENTVLDNQQAIGFTVNSDKSALQGVALDSQVQSIKDQLASPFKSTPTLLQKRLSSLGIVSVEDSTFALDDVGLKRALTNNSDGVLSLFTDPQTGILPQLQNQLDSILKKDLGRVDLKAVQIAALSNVPAVLAGKYQKYVDSFTLQEKVQNLLAVA